MLRRAVVNLAILGVALWAAWGLSVNVRHLQWREAEGLWLDSEPCLWRYGTPPVDRLERFLDRVRPALAGEGPRQDQAQDQVQDQADREPAGPLLFSSPFEGQDALCAYLWAAYLLPEATLRRAPAAAGPGAPLRLHFDPHAGPATGASDQGAAGGAAGREGR